MRKDFVTILKWVGSKDGTLSIDQIEQFVRGYEAYLLEGKAPSIELEGAFSRFRRWLTEVYKSVKQLDVKLTQGVRNVFDRLLTAQTDTTLAAQNFGMTPKTTEELNILGVLPVDQEFMRRLVIQARERAESEMVKDRNKSYKKNIKKWREEAKAQVNASPVYQVIDTVSKAKGFDRELLVEEYGEEILKEMPSNWYRQNGLNPNDVALAAGFVDPETMLGHILVAPRKSNAIDMIVERKDLRLKVARLLAKLIKARMPDET